MWLHLCVMSQQHKQLHVFQIISALDICMCINSLFKLMTHTKR